ncbi:MAG: hypothetical protein ACK4TP_07620 [Hyphomicrobium sp.]|jgi:hypothetical protein
MSNETPSQLHGQSIAEKISKLSAFIGDDLDARAAHGLHITGGCYLLIARSSESPVAQALRGHAVRMASMGIRVRAIFTEVTSPVHLMAPFSMPSECRLARDPRLLAAHEQLSLSPNCTWVGDSMRRDPSKRDALEHYAANCAQTGAHASRSFESLWRATAPLFSVPPIAAALAQMPDLSAAGEALPEGLRRQ